jgi:excisionase family DNA binding protein
MASTTRNKSAVESMPGSLLTPEQVAARLGIGRTYAYQLLRRGEIPSLKLGKLRRVRPQDLDRYLDALAEDQHPGQ